MPAGPLDSTVAVEQVGRVELALLCWYPSLSLGCDNVGGGSRRPLGRLATAEPDISSSKHLVFCVNVITAMTTSRFGPHFSFSSSKYCPSKYCPSKYCPSKYCPLGYLILLHLPRMYGGLVRHIQATCLNCCLPYVHLKHSIRKDFTVILGVNSLASSSTLRLLNYFYSCLSFSHCFLLTLDAPAPVRTHFLVLLS